MAQSVAKVGMALVDLLKKIDPLAIPMIGGAIPEDHQLLVGIQPL